MSQGHNETSVILKQGKEKPLRQRHHWIFSGAIQTMPKCAPGTALRVVDSKGACLGWGYFNAKSSLAGRMLSFDETLPEEAIKLHLQQSHALRKTLFDYRKPMPIDLSMGRAICSWA